jgi:outer membrane protein
MATGSAWLKSWKVLCLAVLWFPAQCYGLGLWDSYQLALENDPAYLSQRNLFSANSERVPQARATLLPQLTGVASHSRGHLEIDPPDGLSGAGHAAESPGEVSISSFNLDPSPIPLDDNYDNNEVALKLRQTVFDRSQWLSLGSARSQVGEARLELEDARRLLVLETTRAFFDLLSALDALDVAGLELKAVQRQLRLTERRYEQDIGTLTDVHESRARVELADIDMINARNNTALARHRLRKLISLPVDHVNRLPESFEPPPLTPLDLSYWINAAKSSSIDLQLAQQKARTAALELKRQRSGHWPTLSLVAESAYEQDGVSTVSTGEDRFRNEISLQLRMPIFSGFAVSSRVREAQYRKFAADLDVRNAHAELARDIQSAFDSVQSSRARVETFKRAYDQSLSALELRERGYLEGLSSNLDLLDALRDTYRSRRQWLQSRHRYLVDYLTLRSLSTTIDDDVIRKLDAYLIKDQE